MLDWINIVISLGSIFVFLIIMYFIEIANTNYGLIDVVWSVNFILATVVSFVYTTIRYQSIYISQIIITALILIWGIRLSYYLAKRNIGKPEDRRYKELREKWGKSANFKAFFIVNMLQALWAAIIVSPIVVANSVYPDVRPGWIVFDGNAAELIPLVIGTVFWLIGFYFETVGDRQLRAFVKNPDNKGKIIESGLWKYTRHPNYFGEITMSLSLFIIVISLAISNPLIWITIIGPIIYTLLIYFVTGVKRSEDYLKTKNGYEQYMERTGILIPLPPKKKN